MYQAESQSILGHLPLEKPPEKVKIESSMAQNSSVDALEKPQLNIDGSEEELLAPDGMK